METRRSEIPIRRPDDEKGGPNGQKAAANGPHIKPNPRQSIVSFRTFTAELLYIEEGTQLPNARHWGGKCQKVCGTELAWGQLRG